MTVLFFSLALPPLFTPLFRLFTGTTSLSGGATFLIAETTKGTKENDECSNRGTCNRKTGLCTCFSGYTNSNGYGGTGTRIDCGAVKPFSAATTAT